MTVAVELEPDAPEPAAAHDHAWRRVADPAPYALGEYRCDVCGAVWHL